MTLNHLNLENKVCCCFSEGVVCASIVKLGNGKFSVCESERTSFSEIEEGVIKKVGLRIRFFKIVM